MKLKKMWDNNFAGLMILKCINIDCMSLQISYVNNQKKGNTGGVPLSHDAAIMESRGYFTVSSSVLGVTYRFPNYVPKIIPLFTLWQQSVPDQYLVCRQYCSVQ